jgi:hypothetical protein
MIRALYNTVRLEMIKKPIEKFKIVYPYYMNGQMFMEQQRHWLALPDHILDRLHFIIVDDGSPEKHARDFIIDSEKRLKMDILRVDADIFWNLEGALNLGAAFCFNEWMFMSDMDHLLPLETLSKIFSLKACRKEFFMFKRLRALRNWENLSDLEPTKMHKGTFLIHWSLYWEVGGRNEDFCGYYSVGWAFRNKLRRFGIQRMLDAYIVGYLGGEIVDSATSVAKLTKEEVIKNRKALRAGMFKRSLPENPIRFPWHKDDS